MLYPPGADNNPFHQALSLELPSFDWIVNHSLEEKVNALENVAET